jgi:hypothetical protein
VIAQIDAQIATSFMNDAMDSANERPSYYDFTSAIGQIAVSMAFLEYQIGYTIAFLLEDLDEAFEMVAETMTAPMIGKLRRVLHDKIQDEGLRARFEELANYILEDLRPRRNKAIHSMWLVGSSLQDVSRMKPRRLKPGMRDNMDYDSKPKVEDLVTLSIDIDRTTAELREFTYTDLRIFLGRPGRSKRDSASG